MTVDTTILSGMGALALWMMNDTRQSVKDLSNHFLEHVADGHAHNYNNKEGYMKPIMFILMMAVASVGCGIYDGFSDGTAQEIHTTTNEAGHVQSVTNTVVVGDPSLVPTSKGLSVISAVKKVADTAPMVLGILAMFGIPGAAAVAAAFPVVQRTPIVREVANFLGANVRAAKNEAKA